MFFPDKKNGVKIIYNSSIFNLSIPNDWEKEDIKTIILPETEDKRVLEAASKVIKQGFAKVILLGDEQNIKEDCKIYKINLDGVDIINPLTSEKKEEYKQNLYELRKNKGMTLEQAEELLKEPIYLV